MSQRNQKHIQPNTANAGFAFLVGDALYKHAQTDLAAIGRDMQAVLTIKIEDLGGVIASATNVALAIELYLKGLLIFSGIPAPHTHDLPELFSLLPRQAQQAIETEYDRLRAAAGPGSVNFELIFADAADKRQPTVDDPSLTALLKRNADAFVSWRYVFTRLAIDDGTAPKYEFLYLGYAAQAIRAQVQVKRCLRGNIESGSSESDFTGFAIRREVPVPAFALSSTQGRCTS